MSGDSVKQPAVYRIVDIESFKSLNFFLQCQVFSIKACDSLCHVSDRIWIKAYAKDHPADCNSMFHLVVSWNITITNSCNCLKAPIIGSDILSKVWCIDHVLEDYPAARWEVIHLCLKVPNAGHQVVDEKHGSKYFHHHSKRVPKLTYGCHYSIRLLLLTLSLSHFHEFKQSKDSEQSPESWQSRYSESFGITTS
mgnify:FL=1